MIIALASPAVASSVEEGLEKVRQFQSEASDRGADIVCFPEAYVPGLRGVEIEVPPHDASQQERVLRAVAQWSAHFGIATILGTERITPAGRQIAAYVFDADGQVLGEVYEWGSFVQSRMHRAGVVCSDCHEPHRATLRAPGSTRPSSPSRMAPPAIRATPH